MKFSLFAGCNKSDPDSVKSSSTVEMFGKLWALNYQVGINLKKKNTTLRPSDVQNTFLSSGPRPRTIKLLRNKTLIAEHENSTIGFLTFIGTSPTR